MNLNKFILLCLIYFIFSSSQIFSEESDYSESTDKDFLIGKEEVQNGNFEIAIRHLKKSIEKDAENADTYNYLGFSYRKLNKNDEAFKFYNKALAINPEHLGAHEYIGELYLKIKQPLKAKEHLVKLDVICFLGCEEYDELKDAIENYEKNN